MFEVREGDNVVMSLSREQTRRMLDYLDRMREPNDTPIVAPMTDAEASGLVTLGGRVHPDHTWP